MIPRNTPRDAVDFYHDHDAPVQPDQYAVEFGKLLDIYKELKPRRVLEIGAREGGTLYQWMKNAEEGALVVVVDLPGAGWGTKAEIDWGAWNDWAKEYGHKLIPIKGDSHAEWVTGLVRDYAPYGFIFIDGDHTLEGIQQDYENYAPMCAKGGVIAIHDILPDATDGDIKVYEFWGMLRPWPACRSGGLDTCELYSDPEQTTRGIGVIWI